MAKAASGLEFILSAKGADGVVREIGRVGQGIQQADRATQKTASGWQKFQGGIRSAGSALRGVWQQMRGIAAITGIGAGLGFATLAKDIMDSEDAALRLRYALGDDAKWKNIEAAVERMRSTTGLTGAELNNAIDAAADFGMEIQAAADSMEDMVAFSKLLGVGLPEVSKVVGAISKATNGAMAPRESMAMLGAAARASGMPEEQFLGGVARATQTMENVSPQQIGQVMQIVAGLGLQGTGREGEIRKAILGAEGLTPKQKKSIGGNLGDTGAETLLRLAVTARDAAGAFDKFDLPDSIKEIARSMAENSAAVTAVADAAAGSKGKMDEFSAAMQTAKESTSTQWGGLMEDIKKQAEPLVRSALSWILDHKTELEAGVQTFLTMFDALAKGLAAIAEFIGGLPIFGGSTSDALRNVIEARQNRVNKLGTGNYISGLEVSGTGADKARADFARTVVASNPNIGTDELRRTVEMMAGREIAAGAFADRNAAAGSSAVRSAAGAAGRFLANIFVTASPETVHATVDAEQDGRRIPSTVTAE